MRSVSSPASREPPPSPPATRAELLKLDKDKLDSLVEKHPRIRETLDTDLSTTPRHRDGRGHDRVDEGQRGT